MPPAMQSIAVAHKGLHAWQAGELRLRVHWTADRDAQEAGG